MNCAHCGATNPESSRFCSRCGSPLGGPRAQGFWSESRGGDLRWASVLFVDLVGYTSLTHSWDAADVRDMLSAYFEMTRRIVDRYGGEVAKFIGDAVVAVWGSRATREDDAERCVRAGMDTVAAVAEFGDRNRLRGLEARGGVVTGRVALLDGANEGLVAGGIRNTPSRTQTSAAAGGGYVGGGT